MTLASALHLRRVARPRPVLASLSPAQIKWLGALLIAVQLPQAPYVPVWVAARTGCGRWG